MFNKFDFYNKLSKDFLNFWKIQLFIDEALREVQELIDALQDLQ